MYICNFVILCKVFFSAKVFNGDRKLVTNILLCYETIFLIKQLQLAFITQ